MPGPNHEGYERRLAVVRDVFSSRGIRIADIDPIDYDPEMPHIYNNFVYRIDLPEPTVEGTFEPSSQPLTTIPKAATKSIIFRLSNPHAEGINNANRVENEVASLHLAQTALAKEVPKYASIIPAVYDWKRLGVTTASSATEPEFGWIMMELLPGVMLETEWADIPLAEKKILLNEIAMVFAAIQKSPLPKGVDTHGGLAIRDGEIVSGQASTVIGGPWHSYAGWWCARFHENLRQAEKSSVVKGWNGNGIRARLDMFMTEGIERSISAIDESKLVLVHGDFSSYNILYDPASHNIVGLFDFDFAFVSHPVHEYLESFHMMKGNLRDSEHIDAISKGAFGEHPPHDGITTEDWAIARDWDSLLAKHGALKPSDISGLEDLLALRKCEGLIAPHVLCHPMIFRRFNDDDLAKRRMEAEKELSDFLEARGF